MSSVSDWFRSWRLVSWRSAVVAAVVLYALIGFFVVQWGANALVKFLVIVLFSLIVTLLVYDIGVRRTRPTRFLFGLKPSESHEKSRQTELDGSEKDAGLARK